MVGAGVAHFPVHFRCVLFVVFCFVMFLRVAHFPVLVGNKWVGGPCGFWQPICPLNYLVFASVPRLDPLLDISLRPGSGFACVESFIYVRNVPHVFGAARDRMMHG